MYRERIHLTVADMDGWNEVIDAMAEMNKVCERMGQPTAIVWTDTVGVFNQLIAEVDHVDLASYEKATKAFYAEPDILKQLQRINAAAVPGKGYTELLETTSAG